MIERLGTLLSDIEATQEDPSVVADLSQVLTDEEEFWTLSPFLRKFLSFTEKVRHELQDAAAPLERLAGEDREKLHLELKLLSMEYGTLCNIFMIQLMKDLIKEKPELKGKVLRLSLVIRKDWKVVGIDYEKLVHRQIMDTVTKFIQNPPYADDPGTRTIFEDPHDTPPGDQSRTKKKKLH